VPPPRKWSRVCRPRPKKNRVADGSRTTGIKLAKKEVGINSPHRKLQRMQLWGKIKIQVSGLHQWTFIKLYTHGALPANQDMLLGKPMADFYQSMNKLSLSGQSPKLHYATAREMVNMIHAAEEGMTGNPDDYRNYRYRSIMHHPVKN
jgi:hypothetical protein